jgi:hypothetical protein
MTPHELAAERSRALHLAVAERIRADPTVLQKARSRVRAWLSDGAVARSYALAWRDLLEGPADGLLTALGENSQRMHDLRQVSPFAGVLDARTRWRIHAEARGRVPR